jgi:hypothetical protein
MDLAQSDIDRQESRCSLLSLNDSLGSDAGRMQAAPNRNAQPDDLVPDVVELASESSQRGLTQTPPAYSYQTFLESHDDLPMPQLNHNGLGVARESGREILAEKIEDANESDVAGWLVSADDKVSPSISYSWSTAKLLLHNALMTADGDV